LVEVLSNKKKSLNTSLNSGTKMKHNDSFQNYSMTRSKQTMEPNRNGKRNTIMSLCMPKLRHDKVKVVRENLSRGRALSNSGRVSSDGPNVETSMLSSDDNTSGPVNYWEKTQRPDKRLSLNSQHHQIAKLLKVKSEVA
jgi:hypothetical protein